jgi:hypothetical protein
MVSIYCLRPLDSLPTPIHSCPRSGWAYNPDIFQSEPTGNNAGIGKICARAGCSGNKHHLWQGITKAIVSLIVADFSPITYHNRDAFSYLKRALNSYGNDKVCSTFSIQFCPLLYLSINGFSRELRGENAFYAHFFQNILQMFHPACSLTT